MTHYELVLLAYKWVLKNGSCGVAFKEFKCLEDEIADVIGFGSSGRSVIIECKVSRSDFLADQKKPFRKDPCKGMGKYRFYAAAKGLIKVTELPENWGLLEVSESGKIRCVHNPYCSSLTGNIWSNGFNQNYKAEMSLMYSALRRLHLRNRIDEIYDINTIKEITR